MGGALEKWGKLMVKEAGTKNTGLKKSFDGLKKLVHKMKLEDTSKQVGFGKAVERLTKIVDRMKEKSNKMEKVTVLQFLLQNSFLTIRELKVPLNNWASRWLRRLELKIQG